MEKCLFFVPLGVARLIAWLDWLDEHIKSFTHAEVRRSNISLVYYSQIQLFVTQKAQHVHQQLFDMSISESSSSGIFNFQARLTTTERMFIN